MPKSKKKNASSRNIYKLKITLDYIDPPIWREILIDSETLLPDLSKIIQTVMGWYNTHLHHFRIDDEIYSLPDEESLSDEIDYSDISIGSLITAEKQKLYYDYDFGSGWEHIIVVEKILAYDTKEILPFCIDGKRNCPPEDCGGPAGYEKILEKLKSPENDDYMDLIDWLGEEYDPEAFEIDAINEMLLEKDYGCISLFD